MMATPMYTIQSLGTLGGGSFGTAVNNSGQVSGYSFTGNGTKLHPFLWDGGVLHDLGTLLPPGVNTQALGWGINDAGTVVGGSGTSLNVDHAFRSNATGCIDDLSLGQPYHSTGLAINNSGQITGYSQSTGQARVFRSNSGGVLVELGTLGTGNLSVGRGINNLGQVTGGANIISGGQLHAFRTDVTGTLFDLGVLSGGDQSQGLAINDSGQVVGYSTVAGPIRTTHAFRTNIGGGLEDLGSLGGGSVGYGINNAGWTVGISATSTFTNVAFLHDGTGMIDLNTILVDGVGWLLTEATGINDLGQIVGTGTFNGESRAFLLTPVSDVPEPSAWMLAGMGLAAMAVRTRRS